MSSKETIVQQKKRDFDIVCVGEMVADIIVRPVSCVDFSVDSMPVEQIEIRNGGDALNTAVNLSRLGCRVAFIGKAGCDAFGGFLIDTASESGVDTTYMRRSQDVQSSKVIVMIREDGDRCFLQYYGSNSEFSAEDIDLGVLKRTRFLHIGGTFHLPSFDGDPAAHLLKSAHGRGITTTMDVAWDSSGRWIKTLAPCFPHLDYFIPSEMEAREITGETQINRMAAFFRDRGVKNVIIKLGKAGVYFNGHTGSFYCSAFEVPVVDTTGAGDAFVSGILAGLSRRCSIETAIGYATAAAAHVIQHVGATEGMPDLDTLERFIRNREPLVITYE